MRRLVTVAPIVMLTVAWVTSPVFAQRGSAHGGFSGHSASSFHGGFSSSGPSVHGFSPRAFASQPRYGITAPPQYNFRTPLSNRFIPSPRYPVGRSANISPRFAGISPGSSFAPSGFAGAGQHRMPYRPPYRGGNNFFGGGVPWTVWPNNYGFAGYPDFYLYPPWWDYDDSSDESQSYAQESSPQDYGSQSPEQQPEYPARPAWPSLSAPQNVPQSPSQTAAEPQPGESVTIVFNNGRPPEKIHNYLLTPATLYVMDQHRSEIPVNQLDLAATEKVNREAGIDFRLPGPSK
jgi:hypothetical protein